MAAAEIFASEQACDSIFMKVISIRHELIAWYERQGYSNSGKTEPFPVDTRFGIPTQPLEFIILEKTIWLISPSVILYSQLLVLVLKWIYTT